MNKSFEIINPIEHKQFKGYYLIPDINDFVINRAGEVLNLKRDGKTISTSVNNKWYRRVSARTEIKAFRWKHHELMARAFVPRPLDLCNVPYDQLEIFHINGLFSNNIAENLRWMTKSDYDAINLNSVYRKYEYYLTKSITALDLKTRAVVIYKDYYEACKELDISILDMANALYNDKTFKRKHFLIREL